MSNIINEFTEAIAGPLDNVSSLLKTLANEHHSANNQMHNQAHNLTTTFQGLGASAFISMIDKQYNYTEGIVQSIDEIAHYIATAADGIRDAAHFATTLIQPFTDLAEEVIHRLSPDLVIREGGDAVHAIIRDMESAVQDMAHTGGSFLGHVFHLNLGGALHDLVDEGKDTARLLGDMLAMLGQVEEIMAHWAAQIFEAMNRVFNQINSVIYRIIDWAFSISDMMGDAATLSDPNATPEEKALAGTMLGVSALLDIAIFIPGVDIFAAGGKLAAKGIMKLLEKFGVDELAKVLTSKLASRVADSVVKEVVDGAINAARKSVTQTVENLAEKGIIKNPLTKEQILQTVGHLLGHGSSDAFDALSPEGKQFLEKYVQYVHDFTNFEDPALKSTTADARAAFFRDQQQTWFSHLTTEEKDALVGYTGNGYSYINDYLRKGIDPSLISVTELQDKYIQHLDKALGDAIIPADTTAQRVVGGNMLDFLKEGNFFTDKGYISTSINSQHPWQNTVRLFIDLPKGLSGGFLEDLTLVPNEYEVLLPRNSVMQVQHVINLQKAALSAADQNLLSKFPDYIVKLLYEGVSK